MGATLTPDKLPAAETAPLEAATYDARLRALVQALQPEWLIGVGGFAEAQAAAALRGYDIRIGRVLHRASRSAANRGWAAAAEEAATGAGSLVAAVCRVLRPGGGRGGDPAWA